MLTGGLMKPYVLRDDILTLFQIIVKSILTKHKKITTIGFETTGAPHSMAILRKSFNSADSGSFRWGDGLDRLTFSL